jgi:hypothetical protein
MADIRDIADIAELIQERVNEAYERGFKAGSEAMRNSILHAATSAPITGAGGSKPIVVVAGVGKAPAYYGGGAEIPAAPRAPRGLVASAIKDVLTASPGMPITEIEKLVLERHPEISPKTIGNELRRGEGDRYVRNGKYSWLLKSEEAEKPAESRWGDSADWFKPKGGEGD